MDEILDDLDTLRETVRNIQRKVERMKEEFQRRATEGNKRQNT
jgi:hypothetical protein